MTKDPDRASFDIRHVKGSTGLTVSISGHYWLPTGSNFFTLDCNFTNSHKDRQIASSYPLAVGSCPCLCWLDHQAVLSRQEPVSDRDESR